ncbi:UDP binding domain-containing protein [Streptomyces sp. NPDC059092]|uniref:UDP binding domain-containing protein n=1 Tax=Streptomyces sp. NPDC059092 TaxID=3346725 RepID=UPI0036A23473
MRHLQRLLHAPDHHVVHDTDSGWSQRLEFLKRQARHITIVVPAAQAPAVVRGLASPGSLYQPSAVGTAAGADEQQVTLFLPDSVLSAPPGSPVTTEHLRRLADDPLIDCRLYPTAMIAREPGPPSSRTPTTSATPPALAVAQKLHELGAEVTVTDPQALDNARKMHPELDYVDDPIGAVQDADLLLHLTEWPQFSHIDPHRLAVRAATARVIDGRGTLNADTWRDAGWTVRVLGRP